MNNRIESPVPENFEPLTPEEVDKLDAIALTDPTALAQLMDAAQSGDKVALYWVMHSKHEFMEAHGIEVENGIVTATGASFVTSSGKHVGIEKTPHTK